MIDDFIKSIKVSQANDSNNFYHSKKEYISASGLKEIKVSPAHFMYSEKKETEALLFGGAYHKYILEPNLFDTEYFVLDETEILEILNSEGSKSPRATNKYKDWYKEQENEASGKNIIALDTFNRIKEMSTVLRRHRYANSLLNGGVSEQSYYFEISTFDGKDIKAKIRPDYMIEKKRICLDLKTCADASLDGFTKQAANFDYHIQAALYSDLLDKTLFKGLGCTFIFIAQEKVKPYAFNIFEASPQFVSQGRYEYEQLMMLYSQCVENNYWSGYQVFCENKYGILSLNMPSWAIKEINYYNHKY